MNIKRMALLSAKLICSQGLLSVYLSEEHYLVSLMQRTWWSSRIVFKVQVTVFISPSLKHVGCQCTPTNVSIRLMTVGVLCKSSFHQFGAQAQGSDFVDMLLKRA